MTTKTEKQIKVYGGLHLSPYFEDGDYWYYPCANGSVWCESKHESLGFSVTRDSAVRSETLALDKWFNLAD